MSIDRYVVTLRTRLILPRAQAAEFADEVRAHLEDAARDLQMSGLDPRESEREAVRRFGPPDEIAAAARTQHSQRRLLSLSISTTRSTMHARPLVALMAAIIVLAALGGNVASAYTSSHKGPRPAWSGAHGTPRARAQARPALSLKGSHS